jgi:hypothetical protein
LTLIEVLIIVLIFFGESVKTFFDIFDVTEFIDDHSLTNHGENDVHLIEVEGIWVA